MDVCGLSHANCIDFVASVPFSISSCSASGWVCDEPSQQQFPVSAKQLIDEEEKVKYRATLWALFPNRSYDICLTLNGDSDEHLSDARGTSPLIRSESTKYCFSYNTLPLGCGIRDPVSFIYDATILCRSDFLDCLLAQPKDYMFIYLSKHCLKELIARLFYQTLFPLPLSQSLGLCSLPNYRQGRYCLDLEREEYPWLRNKKVKRLVSSGLYSVAVNRDLSNSLRTAQEYHLQRCGSTWLNDNFIEALTDMGDDKQLNVGILAVELIEESTGTAVAGCLGFGIGSVFHDFTMFTCQRTTESYGTIITKVMGAALQACGYNMWYWGDKIEYMKQYEGSYGARFLGREEFLRRWALYRDKKPKYFVGDFLRAGKGLLRSWSATLSDSNAVVRC
ncbi:leucyl/phenylalanyl-tRNA protein transferase, putative [Trypanosoma equiperdum]|uniref:Leucyl/phenylalanyl-tRNA protein transferase, putative n=1 Tax=Trypanosoma equiperdum TaxID=5694 RepID=A0A1G4I8L8_TRYEQ|nr:leucyl/phenylalanyl-tRNA protein transferase, putative [Trypanosoma equiperdum]